MTINEQTGEPIKDLGRLDAMSLMDQLALAGYEDAHTDVERQLLEEAGMEEDAAADLANHWRGALAKWYRAIDADSHPAVICWGAANSSVLDVPGINTVLDVMFHIALLLVAGRSPHTSMPRKCAVAHGSSVTGMMGAWDRAWHLATSAFGLTDVPLWNIPLCWVAKEFREIPARSGRSEHRAPPSLVLSSRTDAFGRINCQEPSRRKPALILVAPGGFGTRYEVYWAFLAGQLRKLLLTAFTGWENGLPEVIFLDCEMDVAALREQWEGRHGAEKLHDPWLLHGFKSDLLRMVMARTTAQKDIAHVTVLRVGDGESIDQEDRVGPRVIYRPSPREAAKYVAGRFDLATAPR